MKKTLSIVLKLVVVICASLGVFLSAYAGRNSFMGGTRTMMYFTIQSNIALALLSAVGLVRLFRNTPDSQAWAVWQLVGAVSITLTGAVFCFVLAPTFSHGAWSIQNVLTHVVVPVASIVDYFVSGSKRIRVKDVPWVIVPPILYAIYAGIGYRLNWQFGPGVNYPYFFLNWGSPCGAFGFSKELPFMGCMWWIIMLFVLLLLVGLLYMGIVHLTGKGKSRGAV